MTTSTRSSAISTPRETIEGAPGIKPEHLSVFDCSFKPAKGTRSIQYMGHIKMMAAAQPFLSGAISKTVNLPHEATVEDVAEAYAESWRQGIKAVAIYRDGSKGTQPLNTSMDAKKEPSALDIVGSRVLTQLAAGQTAAEADMKALEAKIGEKLEVGARQVIAAAASFQKAIAEIAKAAPALKAATSAAAHTNPSKTTTGRRVPYAIALPEERASVTHKFSIAGHEGYITVGLYPTGQPGEIFIKMAKEGSTVSGLMDSFATSVSLALAAWRAVEGAVRKVCSHPLRAFRLDRQRADRLCQEPDGLYLPLAPFALSFGRAVGPVCRLCAASGPTARFAHSYSGLRVGRGRQHFAEQLSRLAEEVARKLSHVSGQNSAGASGIGTASPASGIAPEAHVTSSTAENPTHGPSLTDPRHLPCGRRYARYV